MNNIDINIQKLHQKAKLPSKKIITDAAYDLWALGYDTYPDGRIVYRTHIALEIPSDKLGLIFPRSSTSKYNLTLANCVGVIDSSYRGEILVVYKNIYPYIDVPLINSPKNCYIDTPQLIGYGTKEVILDREIDRIYKPTLENPERVAQILFIDRVDVNWNIVDIIR